ncbi:MAG: nucleotidyltransferase family protein [Cellvibrionaceae bacterium]
MMKAMIFAAGRGERMAELTRATPKPLLKVAGKPLIDYTVRRLQQAGIREMVINVAYLGEQIQQYLGDGSRLGVAIVYSREPYPLETGGAIGHALELLGEAPFVVVNADIWTDYPFEKLLNHQFDAGKLGHLVMVPNPSQLPTGDFYLNEALLLQPERDNVARDSFTYSGIALLHPRLVAEYSRRREKFPLVEAFREAMQDQRLSGEVYRGQWRDIGTPERLRQLQQEVTGR